MSICDHTIIGFNFPDYNITDESDHRKMAYGTVDEILPLLYILNFYVCNQDIEKINLYGVSSGGGAVINALAILNKYSYQDELQLIGITHKNAKKILSAIDKGIVILECPLKSVQKIIDFMGATENLLYYHQNYEANHLNPITTVQQLINLKLTILLHFTNPDEVLSNRDDVLFIDRLKQANKGITHITTDTHSGHSKFHAELWRRYKQIK